MPRPQTAAGKLAAALDPVVRMRQGGINPDPWQIEVLRTTARRVIVCASRQAGKALHVDTPIVTPRGWTTMGRLQPGDQVFDQRGRVCFVLSCSPVMERPVMRVRFSDGSEIVADEDHLWTTLDAAARSRISGRLGGELPQDWPRYRSPGRNRPSRLALPDERVCSFEGCGRPVRVVGLCNGHAQQHYSGRTLAALERPQPGARTLTTLELAATQASCVRGDTNHSIPATAPLELPPLPLAIDPYVFGCWLGDGTSVDASLTCADPEIVEEIRAVGYEVVKQPSRKYGWSIRGLYRDLRLLGLLGAKRIPDVHLRASVEQRIALLQGLMDTDGSAVRPGTSQCEFTTTSRRLAEGFEELATSLGLIVRSVESDAKLNGRVVGRRWRIAFCPWFVPFRLSRKAARIRLDGPRKTLRRLRYVVAVEPAGTAPVRCVTVSSPSSLYLAGRAMVPTHNSQTIATLALHTAETLPNSEIVIGAVKQDQAAEMLRKAMAYIVIAGSTSLADVDNQSVLRVELKNKSRIVAVPGKGATVRSYSALRILIVDEAAYVADDFYQAVFPMVAVSRGRIILLSSMNTTEGTFYDVWMNAPTWNFDKPADEQEDAWLKVFVPWTACPRIRPEFIEAERRRFGERYVQREYMCVPTEPDESAFRWEDIERMKPGGIEAWDLPPSEWVQT